MTELALAGLSGTNPLGAMAAFGLLRILANEDPFGPAKLAWDFDVDWHPRLHLEKTCKLDQVIDFLIDRQPTRTKAPFLSWNDDIKSSPEVFRDLWEAVRRNYDCQDDGEAEETAETATFLAAFGSEAVKDKKARPDVKPTAFHMTAGQQRFLKSVKEVADSLDPRGRSAKRQTAQDRRTELRQAYETALSGPWTYRDTQHSLGWDPTTEGLHALSDISPSEARPKSVRAAVWLAFESLPLFPAVPSRKRLHTTGFDANGSRLTWPLWEPAISVDTLRVLLGSLELCAEPPATRELDLRGVRVVLTSHCVRDANGRGTFRNAVGIHGYYDGAWRPG